MLELTTLFIFTWLTLRVRYFHTYFKDFVVFDLDLSSYAVVRWFYSIVMTDNNSDQQSNDIQETSEYPMHIRRSSVTDLDEEVNGFISKNLLMFREEIPTPGSILPHPRSGHRAVATESDLWTWGGYYPEVDSNPRQMFKELWRYNFALRRWTLEKTSGDEPEKTLASHSMCLFRNKLLVFGGTGFPFGSHVSNDLFVLDLNRLHWKRLSLCKEKPRAVYGASMILHEPYLYILCGTDSWIYNSDIYEIHLPTLSCTQIGFTFDEIEDSFETGRYRQEAFLHNNKIFVFGGGGVTGISFSLENLPVFDLKTRTWSFVHTNPDPIHKFPTARKFHSIFPFHENQLIMFGGAHFDSETLRHYFIEEYSWSFDLDRLEWSALTSLTMLRPTYFHAAAMNERGEIWVHGGVVMNTETDDEEAEESRTTSIYTMQTRPLKLNEICWNRFLNTISDRSSLLNRTDRLAQLSIPPRFIERIH